MGMAVSDLMDNEFYKYKSFKYVAYDALWVIMMLYGSVAALYYVISAADLLMDLFVRDPVSFEKYGANEGHWAVVAGCTDEVGKEMALQLADKGFNLMLLAPDSTQLQSLEKIVAAKGRSVRCLTIDFAGCSESDWQALRDLVAQEQVSVLVNNTSVCHAAPTFFDEEDQSLCDKIVEANVTSTMNITRIVVPQMQARSNGLIINMGSFTAMRSMPFLSVYAGSKGFVKTFSQSLAYELEPQGIMVSYVFGLADVARMFGRSDYSATNPAPALYVQSVFDRLGLKCGAPESHTTIPYSPHSILNFVSSCLWDPMHAKPVYYSIGRSMYQYGKRQATSHSTVRAAS
ncbi:hypothetical protein H4S02_001501 [Coemansia sp. RSA 2611]|nr:hypothetical protein H4S02_001501 [Coemansia sp. RSA 2611]